MLKYIGDFEKLKEFDFVESITTRNCYAKTISIEGFNVYNMKIMGDRRILIEVELFNGKPLSNLDLLYDLIKAGLVVKEEE